MKNEREERARATYGETCEMPLPWMQGSVQNDVADIITAMLAFADDELERAANRLDAHAELHHMFGEAAAVVRGMKGDGE